MYGYICVHLDVCVIHIYLGICVLCVRDGYGRMHPFARVCICDLAPSHPRRNVRAPSAGVDLWWLGSQAFGFASAFNANIGAWNTASLSSMQLVCAALSASGRGATAGGTHSAGSSMRRGPLCAAAPPMRRARWYAQTCGHSHARVSTCVGIAVRTQDGLCAYVCLYMYVYIYYKYV
jgi:hypothetical protein